MESCLICHNLLCKETETEFIKIKTGMERPDSIGINLGKFCLDQIRGSTKKLEERIKEMEKKKKREEEDRILKEQFFDYLLIHPDDQG